MKTLETKDARSLFAALSSIEHDLFGSKVHGPIHMILEYAEFFFPRFVRLPANILSTSMMIPDIQFLARKYHEGISLWEVPRHFTDDLRGSEVRAPYFTFPINTGEISGLTKWTPRVPVLFKATDAHADLCLTRMLFMKNAANDLYDDPLKQRLLIKQSGPLYIGGVPVICLGRPVPDAWPHIVAFAIPHINSGPETEWELGTDRLRPLDTDRQDYMVSYVDISKTQNLQISYVGAIFRRNSINSLSWVTIPSWELESRLFNTIARHNHSKRVEVKEKRAALRKKVAQKEAERSIWRDWKKGTLL